MDRMITLSVGTVGDEDYVRTFQDFSELAKSLGEVHTFTHLSCSLVGEDDVNVDVNEDLYHDEGTLDKVKQAIQIAKPDILVHEIDDIVNQIQNLGVLFREPSTKDV